MKQQQQPRVSDLSHTVSHSDSADPVPRLVPSLFVPILSCELTAATCLLLSVTMLIVPTRSLYRPAHVQPTHARNGSERR